MKKITHKLIRCLFLSAGLLMAFGPFHAARAQTSEALIEALVRKGILTEQEAEDIKKRYAAIFKV